MTKDTVACFDHLHIKWRDHSRWSRPTKVYSWVSGGVEISVEQEREEMWGLTVSQTNLTALCKICWYCQGNRVCCDPAEQLSLPLHPGVRKQSKSKSCTGNPVETTGRGSSGEGLNKQDIGPERGGAMVWGYSLKKNGRKMKKTCRPLCTCNSSTCEQVLKSPCSEVILIFLTTVFTPQLRRLVDVFMWFPRPWFAYACCLMCCGLPKVANVLIVFLFLLFSFSC